MSEFLDKIVKFFAIIASALVVVLSLLVVYEATNRYLFNASSHTNEEIIWHIYDIIFLLGLSFTMQRDKHVRVDLIYANLTKKSQAWINALSYIFIILPFSAMVIYTSYTFVEMSFLQNECSPDPGGLCYRYLIKGVIILGFVLVIIQALSNLLKDIKTIKGTLS
jgi:TRAP-type mannitol/chloroaromatic compound transport system permease small subunit